MLSKMIWMHLGSHKAKHDAVTMWKPAESSIQHTSAHRR